VRERFDELEQETVSDQERMRRDEPASGARGNFEASDEAHGL
jgi:hypothetical protein